MLQVKKVTIIPRGNTQPIVDNVSFEVHPKKIHALIGPNGSGKSSLAYAIMGLASYKPTKGKIIFNGEDITNFSITQRAKKGITLAWQEPVRFEGISIRDYIKVGNRNSKEEKVERLLNLVELSPKEYLNRKVDGSLSGGERKRVELASVVAMRPKLLILDEPDAGLDIIVYNEFYQMLDVIRRETHASILLITHREESGQIADEGTLLWKGKVKARGSFGEVMHKYCQLAGRRAKCKKFPCLTKF